MRIQYRLLCSENGSQIEDGRILRDSFYQCAGSWKYEGIEVISIDELLCDSYTQIGIDILSNINVGG